MGARIEWIRPDGVRLNFRGSFLGLTDEDVQAILRGEKPFEAANVRSVMLHRAQQLHNTNEYEMGHC